MTGKLNEKQKLFVNAYFVNNGNATRAAEQAGYQSPNVAGSRLKSEPIVAAEIKRRLDENAMPANEVLARLADMARATIEDFVDLGKHDPGYPQALQGKWSLDLHKAKEAGKLPLIKSIKSGEFGPEIVLHDAQSALVQLGRYHKLFTDKVEHDFTKLSDAELIALAKSTLSGDGQAGTDVAAEAAHDADGLPGLP